MANQEQLQILRQGYEVWNLWRKENQTAIIDLVGANLGGADLRGADLTGANLNGADLTGANLMGANLIGADLSGANLSGANLRSADLRSTDLRGANLSDADLFGIRLNQDQRRQIREAEGIKDDGVAYYGGIAVGSINVGGNEYGNINIGNVIPTADEVSFTAFHPKESKVESWQTLLVYAHLLSALVKVQDDAKRFNDQISSPKETTSESSTKILRGTEITVVPTCADITFNPPSVSFKWMEDFHRADFRFKADQSLSDDAAKGSIDIFAGPLIIGTLKFAMLFNEKEVFQPIPDHEEHAKIYDKDDVFISYSRKDTEVARTFKTVLEGTGLNVFLDVDDIRSGQDWEKELKRRIEKAKIFQIFWSPNYSQSENCKQEWEYALKQNKEEGYIRPVFWESPLSPKPPEELNKFNFKYVEMKI